MCMPVGLWERAHVFLGLRECACVRQGCFHDVCVCVCAYVHARWRWEERGIQAGEGESWWVRMASVRHDCIQELIYCRLRSYKECSTSSLSFTWVDNLPKIIRTWMFSV